MILHIDTTKDSLVSLRLTDGLAEILAKSYGPGNQSETLLPAISSFLLETGRSLSDLSALKARCQGGSFTSVRIGVTTANVLAYALDIPIVDEDAPDPSKGPFAGPLAPIYDREPNITVKKPIF
jgi:tRNA threonylcarbamoyladenosine biosynthesis protein TsaB